MPHHKLSYPQFSNYYATAKKFIINVCTKAYSVLDPNLANLAKYRMIQGYCPQRRRSFGLSQNSIMMALKLIKKLNYYSRIIKCDKAQQLFSSKFLGKYDEPPFSFSNPIFFYSEINYGEKESCDNLYSSFRSQQGYRRRMREYYSQM